MKKVIPIVVTAFVVPIVSGELNSARATQDITVDGSTLIDVPLEPKQATGARTNCGKDGWQPWVECSTGEVATGVVAHFEAGDSPRAVTGLALECAQVKQSP